MLWSNITKLMSETAYQIKNTPAVGSGEARRKWMVVPITYLRTLKLYQKRQLYNYTFDRNGKVLLLENDHKNDGN